MPTKQDKKPNIGTKTISEFIFSKDRIRYYFLLLTLMSLIICCRNDKINRHYSGYLNAYIIDTINKNIKLAYNDKIILYKGRKLGEYKIGAPISSFVENGDSNNHIEADSKKVNLILDTFNFVYQQNIYRYIIIENLSDGYLYIGKNYKAYLLLENYKSDNWIPCDTIHPFLCGLNIQDVSLHQYEVAICKINIEKLKEGIQYRYALKMRENYYTTAPFYK